MRYSAATKTCSEGAVRIYSWEAARTGFSDTANAHSLGPSTRFAAQDSNTAADEAESESFAFAAGSSAYSFGCSGSACLINSCC